MSLLDRLRGIARRWPPKLYVYRKLQAWWLSAGPARHEKIEIVHDRPLSAGNLLVPLGSVTNKEEFMRLMDNPAFEEIQQMEKELLALAGAETFSVEGFCIPCGRTVSFLVDMQSGGQRLTDSWIPNWRERLVCPLCQMNNRQRLIATLVKQELSVKQAKQVYFMEQITPIFKWSAAMFKQHRLIGSEYLGHEYAGGTMVKTIRHEDIEHLSFANEQLDLIVSNDVFEHVPNPDKAFAQCARVLKHGGIMLATIPFHRNSDVSVHRARLINGRLMHILPPAYHGNPVSAKGSLVFTDFGWDLLDLMKDAGFFDVTLDVYASSAYGHLGGGQLVFRAGKRSPCTTTAVDSAEMPRRQSPSP